MVPNAELTRIIEEWIDEDTGVKHRQVSKEYTDKPIKLGSINKPQNEDIINIKITIPKNIDTSSGAIDISKLFKF